MRSIEDLLPIGEIWTEEINPVLGAHIGPGVVGFAGVATEEHGGTRMSISTPAEPAVTTRALFIGPAWRRPCGA